MPWSQNTASSFPSKCRGAEDFIHCCICHFISLFLPFLFFLFSKHRHLEKMTRGLAISISPYRIEESHRLTSKFLFLLLLFLLPLFFSSRGGMNWIDGWDRRSLKHWPKFRVWDAVFASWFTPPKRGREFLFLELPSMAWNIQRPWRRKQMACPRQTQSRWVIIWENVQSHDFRLNVAAAWSIREIGKYLKSRTDGGGASLRST